MTVTDDRPPETPSQPPSGAGSSSAEGLAGCEELLRACMTSLQQLTAADPASLPVAKVKASPEQSVVVLRRLEELKCAAAAAQAAVTARLDAATRSAEAAQGIPAARQGRGVAGEVALARRTSPWHGRRLLGLAKILPAELPHTWEAFRGGHITETATTWIAQQTACLSVEDRLQVDRQVAGNLGALSGLSERQIRQATATAAARVDPASVARRRARAVADRRVSVTPAPDGMSRLTITVPLEQGVSAYAALKKHADALHGTAAGGDLGRGALMADAAISRLTGRATATDTPVRINLVMSDQTLFGGHVQQDAMTREAAIVERGVGSFPLPAELARRLAASAARGAVAWIRRVYAHPDSGQLVALDSRSRQAPAGIADFVTLRDQSCRTPYCDAPIRHIDHVRPVERGGPTSVGNLQGLCEACNHVKQAPEWHQESHTGADGSHYVATTTPAGQQTRSQAPRSAIRAA